ncbi:MAG TPA: ATP-binding protein [Bryobacteraceae bacterium]|nr:ATP-binding protein [Bryobacteraceae bacterium]
MFTDRIAANSQDAAVPAERADRVKLLLCDDDRNNLLALQAVLQPLGQELILAESGTAALRLCLENDFAAILLDVRMPEIDGFDIAELIRSRPSSARVPILFLTAYRSDEQLFRGYHLGAVDFLFKPIVPEILQSKVRVFVDLSLTEQMLRRKTEALTRTEAKFRAVLEAAPDAMLITAQDGIVRLANSRTDLLFGYDRNRLIGSRVTDLIPDWRVPDLVEIGAPADTDLETRLGGLHRDGSQFPIEVTCSPFETNEGMLITLAVRDATEKVQAEERIRRINTDLERRVAERTVELTRSNEALRQFAWAASHDLQEPIRMVLSYSQWLARSARPRLIPHELDKLVCIQDNASRLATLLTDLRQYIFLSESEQGALTLVDCNAVLRTARENLEGPTRDAGAIIDSEHLPTVFGIEILILQVLQNLISNSIKYRSDETPVIRITTKAVPDGWLFSVADNGIGIDPNQAEYVFGVFRRLHGRNYAGTGIGLAICKAAIERLGGRIWIEPQPGPGTVVQFFLPRELTDV